MELNVIWKHARTAALECCEGSVYEMEEPCRISLNGVFYKESRQVVNLLQGLEPGKEYHVSVERGEEAAEIMFCTDTQDYTLNVRDFGAKGDGVQDDTTYIQAADHVMPEKQSCADSGRNVSSDQSVSERSSHNGAGKRCSAFGIYRA